MVNADGGGFLDPFRGLLHFLLEDPGGVAADLGNQVDEFIDGNGAALQAIALVRGLDKNEVLEGADLLAVFKEKATNVTRLSATYRAAMMVKGGSPEAVAAFSEAFARLGYYLAVMDLLEERLVL